MLTCLLNSGIKILKLMTINNNNTSYIYTVPIAVTDNMNKNTKTNIQY